MTLSVPQLQRWTLIESVDSALFRTASEFVALSLIETEIFIFESLKDVMKLLNISLLCMYACVCVWMCVHFLRSSGGWPGGGRGRMYLWGKRALGQRWVLGGGELPGRVWDWEHELWRHGILLQQRWGNSGSFRKHSITVFPIITYYETICLAKLVPSIKNDELLPITSNKILHHVRIKLGRASICLKISPASLP